MLRASRRSEVVSSSPPSSSHSACSFGPSTSSSSVTGPGSGGTSTSGSSVILRNFLLASKCDLSPALRTLFVVRRRGLESPGEISSKVEEENVILLKEENYPPKLSKAYKLSSSTNPYLSPQHVPTPYIISKGVFKLLKVMLGVQRSWPGMYVNLEEYSTCSFKMVVQAFPW